LSEAIRLCSVDDVPPGTGLEVAVAGRIVAVFNVEGRFYALDGICPHAGGPLGKGRLSGTVVTCPWHGWQFDVASGQHCLNARMVQSSYAVNVVGNDVLIELP
jgi:nitrite reductase (NADH) small subunit